MKMIKPIVNFAKIADDYDTFVFGFNGVLSDGNVIFPAAADCLKKLAAMKKKIVIVSNMALRVVEVVEQLQKCGVPAGVFANIVTAGEMLHYRLKYPRGDYEAVGEIYYQIGDAAYSKVMSNLPHQRTNMISKAHFLFMSSTASANDTIDAYRPSLEQAVSFGLPFICAGNDTSCFKEGKLSLAPGAFAEAYAVLGGRVITLGKPDVRMLNYALEGLGDISRVVVVGDNAATDIKMAAIAGYPSVLVSKGRHINYLGEGYIPDVAKTRELSNSFDVSPDCVISEVRW
ncbi:MAG: TIGR01459 family HAD-type hydrolase [Alphaproteobacteria bacterium]|nr:TIGR01459 family HAD-type hydrolase [Alphaproteobacteria bacterium]